MSFFGVDTLDEGATVRAADKIRTWLWAYFFNRKRLLISLLISR